MKIDRKEVEKVARLARLALSDAEIAAYQGELSEILTYIGKLREIDTSNVTPTAQVTGLTNALADDVVANEPQAAKLLQGVPARQRDAIKVRAVFDE